MGGGERQTCFSNVFSVYPFVTISFLLQIPEDEVEEMDISGVKYVYSYTNMVKLCVSGVKYVYSYTNMIKLCIRCEICIIIYEYG